MADYGVVAQQRTRRLLTSVTVVAAVASCTSSPRESATSPTPTVSLTTLATCPPTITVVSGAVAGVLRCVTGATPVLLPMALPSGGQAEVAAARNFFAVTYTHGNQLVQVAVEVPNPAPPSVRSLGRVLSFRDDGHADYQLEDTTVATADRWLMWNEPGRWAGDPQVSNSARLDNVPYFVRTTGLTEAMFWQVANSLRPVDR
jgi:hypothetical protein